MSALELTRGMIRESDFYLIFHMPSSVDLDIDLMTRHTDGTVPLPTAPPCLSSRSLVIVCLPSRQLEDST